MWLGVLVTSTVLLAALAAWAKSQHMGQEMLLWRFSIAEAAGVGWLVNIQAPAWMYVVVAAGIIAIVGLIETVSDPKTTTYDACWTVGEGLVAFAVSIAVVLVVGLSAPTYLLSVVAVICMLLTYTSPGKRLTKPLKRRVDSLCWI